MEVSKPPKRQGSARKFFVQIFKGVNAMDRRTFNKLASLGAMRALKPDMAMGSQQASAPQTAAHIPPRKVEWPSQTYRRLLIDTHVPDWDQLTGEL